MNKKVLLIGILLVCVDNVVFSAAGGGGDVGGAGSVKQSELERKLVLDYEASVSGILGFIDLQIPYITNFSELSDIIKMFSALDKLEKPEVISVYYKARLTTLEKSRLKTAQGIAKKIMQLNRQRQEADGSHGEVSAAGAVDGAASGGGRSYSVEFRIALPRITGANIGGVYTFADLNTTVEECFVAAKAQNRDLAQAIVLRYLHNGEQVDPSDKISKYVDEFRNVRFMAVCETPGGLGRTFVDDKGVLD
jgi:hypothetical protein